MPIGPDPPRQGLITLPQRGEMSFGPLLKFKFKLVRFVRAPNAFPKLYAPLAPI